MNGEKTKRFRDGNRESEVVKKDEESYFFDRHYITNIRNCQEFMFYCMILKIDSG